MHYLDLTLATASANLALDEALLLEAEAGGGEWLRLWEWPQPAVVLGSGCRLADDVDEAACRAEDVPLLRRASGGGTVLLGRGCLAYSLVLRYERALEFEGITSAYRYILTRLANALLDIQPDVHWAGTSDLAAGKRKFSGNAQQRKRSCFLHHGTILYDFDLALPGRYLLMPRRQPDYRKGRAHEEFLCNLPGSVIEVKQRLRGIWELLEAATAWPEERVRELLDSKYNDPRWTRRR